MRYTTKSLEAKIITQEEADLLENWINANCHLDSCMVPKHLEDLWEKVYLFNFENGSLQ